MKAKFPTSTTILKCIWFVVVVVVVAVVLVSFKETENKPIYFMIVKPFSIN